MCTPLHLEDTEMTDRPLPAASLPRILVLLATHNGARYLPEQLDSVLNQRGVDVHVLISDDNSSDATPSLLESYAVDARVEVLPQGRFGSAAKNFYRLILDADAAGFDAIGFCDQDDLWHLDKLQRHFDLLELPRGLDGRGPYSAVSSNVVSFDERGNRKLIRKSQPQRLLDFAFEAGGPGSTILLRPEAFDRIRNELRRPDGIAISANAHDWLMYALVRASGARWHIDDEPTVEYRQHDENVLGANEGLSQHLRRLRAISDGTYRADVLHIIRAARMVASGKNAARLSWVEDLLTQNTLRARARLARRSGEFRRRTRDQLVLAATLLCGL